MSEQPSADATPSDEPEVAGARDGRPTSSEAARPDDEAPGNFLDDTSDDIPEPNEPA